MMLFWMGVALQAAAPADAGATVDDDVRSIAVLDRISGFMAADATASERTRGELKAAIMYFVGRADARLTTPELVRAVEQASKIADTSESFKAAGQRCTQRMMEGAQRFGE